MAVPDFQSFFAPFLKYVDDGAEHSVPELKDRLADQFGLTAEDRAELIPSGIRTRLYDRVSWAKTYLQAAGLIETVARGRFRITPEGQILNHEGHSRIDVGLLRKRYPAFRAFHSGSGSIRNTSVVETTISSDLQSPTDAIEESYRRHRAGLVEEVLNQLKTTSPGFFETTVVELMLRLGYGGAEGRGAPVGRSGDGGVDGIISEDKLGLDVVYLQAKRWEGVIGRPVVQAFVGSLEGFRARKGVLITTSSFTADARSYVDNIEKRVVLVDGPMLAGLMIDTGLGLTPEKTYTVYRIDSDFFSEEA